LEEIKGLGTAELRRSGRLYGMTHPPLPQ